MTVEAAYIPDIPAQMTFDWVARQLQKISRAIGQGDSGAGLRGRTKEIDSAVDTTYNVNDSDEILIIDTTTAPVTVNLTSAADARLLTIMNVTSSTGNNITAVPDSGDDYNYTGGNATITPKTTLSLVYSASHANHFSL